ncbi:MAG TPA: hypothetical protein ENK06_12760, partial [Gammaproteobacteria bacterium]|nr:hypothetical protein [Gammaproteobacteria bacterium]
MTRIKNFILGIPPAFVVTVGLAVTMAALIHVDFKPPSVEKITLNFQINPQVYDIPEPEFIKQPKLTNVAIPPAPPRTGFRDSQAPVIDQHSL